MIHDRLKRRTVKKRTIKKNRSKKERYLTDAIKLTLKIEERSSQLVHNLSSCEKKSLKIQA